MAYSSSSSHFAPAYSSQTYDVFISFIGEDTCRTFVDHLYTSLVQQGIYTFKDDETLPPGESIGPNLFKAIRESRIALIVFSENYADSCWCLDELEYIMKCMDETGQTVLPIFYHIRPSEVRNQTGKYGEALAKHELQKNNKVKSWRKALTNAGNLSGWEFEYITYRDEAKVIKEITNTIVKRLAPRFSHGSEDLVGVSTRVQDLISQLEIGVDDVRMCGIWGVGGSGKTTLASLLYDEISSMYDGCCFVENIREKSGNEGLKRLQEKILSDVLKRKQVEVHIIGEGMHYKKVLIVLDDVSHIEHLNALARSKDWFGKGSRIIITTRDEHLLKYHKVDVIHKIRLLDDDEAVKLLHKHASYDNMTSSIKDIEVLSKEVVSYAGGLPLALKVLGSFLCNGDTNEWRSAVTRLKEIPDFDNAVLNMLHPAPSSFYEELTELQDLKSSYSQSAKTWSSHLSDNDVFVSFRGEDTRNNFVYHLCKALVQKGMSTIRYHKRPLQKASIRGSRVAVIVFSQNYARSSWRLNELAYIMACRKYWGRTVVPIFYDVEPSEVRNQMGAYGEALAYFKLQSNDNIETWRKALSDASNLSGWDLKKTADGNESQCIKLIVDDISEMLYPVPLRSIGRLVGIEARIQELKSMSTIGSGVVCFVGIWGPVGGGKTTLASSIYNESARNFDGCCFVENIWENVRKHGLKSLQERILTDVLKKKQLEVHIIEEGMRRIKRKLHYKKVLIVLDGVDHVDQLEALAGSHDWFGKESRIIITSRDAGLLRVHKVDMIHHIRLLDDDEAIELFHMHAFRDYKRRKEDFKLLSKDVVSYAGGLPLALKVMGSFLCDKDMIEWESALARLKRLKFNYGDRLAPLDLAYELECPFWENYLVLTLNNSLQKHLWKGYKFLLHLSCINLSYMHDIVKTTPDFGGLPCVQVLKLHYCSSLEEIHPSLGHHASLFYLSIIWCHKLRMLPTITGMKKLKKLEILDCDALHDRPISTVDTVAEFSHPLSSFDSVYPFPTIYSQWRNHDIFLSFIEDNDSKEFVDCLYSNLIQQGIHTYKPNETLSPSTLGPSVLNAIEESQIAIIIFSKNYAGSSRCLDELSYIMKCIDMRGLHVMPIFFDVSSTDVQGQNGEFGKVFGKQESENMAKVESWRKALKGACNHSGWSLKHIVNRHEGRYIKDIVATVSHTLFSLISKVNKDLIGIEPRLQDLTSTLKIESEDVHMVVVWGMGGSGKTTIASCVYMEISRQFEGRCFVENIREESSKYGMQKLQEKILSTILKKEVDVPSDEEGRRMIQGELCTRKVLIVLDDVIDLHQLESLAGSHDWFGKGSRIIVTSREEHVLMHKVDAAYDVSLLSDDEARELFRRHVYPEYELARNGKWRPSSSFLEAYNTLSQYVISYAGELPLTLKVLGSFLYDKGKDEWINALASLKDIPNPRIMDKLQISYDGLQLHEKELFLDIACFFKGKVVDTSMTLLLSAFHAHLNTTLDVLVQKSLVTISNRMFDMHDLVQEMGHNIIREKPPKHPKKYTRVWEWYDVADICATNTTKELNKIQALYAPDYDAPPNLLNVVANMKNLRLLNVCQETKEVVEEPIFLSNALRWISWENYPASSFPSSFQPTMLVSLTLRNGLQKLLWQDFQYLPRMIVLDLHGSKNLIMTPDFNGLPNLERLVLSFCSSLKDIDTSIGYHEKLVYLNMDGCEKLETFPPIIRMKKLETLILSRCSRLLKFPDIKRTMNDLRHLYMDYTGIEVLPSTVGRYCTNLVLINLIGCDNLKRIEGSFQRLKQRCVILVNVNDTRKDSI